MGAIRKTEQERFAYLLNVLVSLLPPPTRPVDCMSYFSICNKQLGNYYCYNQINNSCCDVALWTDLKGKKDLFMDLVLLGWAALVSFSLFSSGSMLSFFFSLLFSLSLFTPAFFIPPSLVSLSRTFMKGELVWWRQCGPAWTAALRSLSASMHQSFFCCSFFLIWFGWR